MAIEIVDLSIKNGGSFHSYVKLPEGTSSNSSSTRLTGALKLNAGNFFGNDPTFHHWRKMSSSQQPPATHPATLRKTHQ